MAGPAEAGQSYQLPSYKEMKTIKIEYGARCCEIWYIK